MALHKIRDFDPDYRNFFDNENILDYDLYSGQDKVGSIDDLLVDDSGSFRYFVINTGLWVFGKKVLLPVGRSRISHTDRRVYVDGLTRQQVEQLPEYHPDRPLDYEQEERVRGVYRPMAIGNVPTDRSAPLDTSASLESGAPSMAAPIDRDRLEATPAGFDRDTYRYEHEPHLYNLSDESQPRLRLYEERLVANKQRHRAGEVAVGKRVETEQAHVSVPVERERVVIERMDATSPEVVTGTEAEAFREGEVARIEVYEETPNIQKEAFVREEVRVRKEVEQQTVEAEETLRREQLDVQTEGNPVLEGGDLGSGDRPGSSKKRRNR